MNINTQDDEKATDMLQINDMFSINWFSDKDARDGQYFMY